MDYAAARRHMVDSQILPNRVTDERLIAAIEELPRELFVADAFKGVAYADNMLDLGDGRATVAPMVVARMVQAAEVRAEDVVLVVGSGEGYASALLSKLASVVFALESDPELAKRAATAFDALDLTTISTVQGALAAGHAPDAPYDVIFCNGAVPEVPRSLTEQLNDRGRLVAVERKGTSRAVIVSRFGDAISHRELFDAVAPTLPGFERQEAFSL